MRKTATALAVSMCLVITAGCSGNKTTPGSALSSASSCPVSSAVDSSATDSSSEESSETESSNAESFVVNSKAPAKNPSSGSAGTAPEGSDFTEPEEAETVTITIPEGYTLARIASKLEANGICKEDEFIQTAQMQSFSSYPLLAAMPVSSKRAYKLEGYLYPDTYQFYKDMKPKDVLEKFVSNAQDSIGGKYRYSGMTTDEIIRLASIIEKEADDTSDMKMVSAIFHNRLNKGMQIQADATITYCTYCLLAPNGPFDDKFKYYYNTYRCEGLPAGPICNPGANALNAAANPAKSDNLYFITKDGKYYYQKTLDEHKAKLKELGMSDDQ